MFSEPAIHGTPKLEGRSYVSVYIDGNRVRIYNGKDLGVNCNPNRARTIAERDKALSSLCYQLKKKLEQGWRPGQSKTQPIPKAVISVGKAFTDLQADVKKEAISELYRRDLLSICDHFMTFLKRQKLEAQRLPAITTDHIDLFLQSFKSSATNYMNRRRTLSSLFSKLVTKKLIAVNPVQETGRLKQVAHLNLPYKKEQLSKVLQFVKERNEHVYLCCLLMYGCLLRPHQEIRMLQRGHFDEELTKISLGGNENESRRIRSVLIPDYVSAELKCQNIPGLGDGINIFSLNAWAYNLSYFNTAWSRIKEDLLKGGIISQDHTLYSFRHTAAVNMYLKTKDPYKIQQAFGHSSLRVTLTYLRNLGLVVDASLEDLPELPM